jgi:hypothetical protein
MPSLPRIFSRDAETSHRFSANFDSVETQTESHVSIVADPWRPLVRISSEDKGGLSRNLKWLCLFARSGVEVPIAVFTRFSNLITAHDSSLLDSLSLVKAAMFSTWFKSAGRQELQIIFAQLHTRLVPHIKTQLTNHDDVDR